MKKLIALHILLLCLSVLHSAAQHNIRFERIGSRQGLSHQKVSSTFQDHQGFIWVATDFGLNRFDGVSCKTFYHKKKDTNSLVHNIVLSLAEDDQYNLWIGTSEGISCFNPFAQTFTNYSSHEKGKRFFPKGSCTLFRDRHNRMWVGHATGFSYFDTTARQFYDIEPEVRSHATTSFLHDSKDRLWASTSAGVKLIDQKTLRTTTYYFNDTLPAKKYYACQIAEDRKGRIFVGTWGDGVLYFDETSSHFVQKHIPAISQTIHAVLPVVENGTDYLLLGTEEGLVKTKTDDLIHHVPLAENYLPDKQDDESISHHVIYNIMQDRSLNTWIASENGVNKIDPLNQQFQTFLSPVNSGLPQHVNHIYSAFNDKQYWLSTCGQHYFFEKKSRTFGTVILRNKDKLVEIRSMTKGKNHFWLISPEGILQYDTGMKMVRQYGPDNSADSFPAKRLYAACEDHTGKVWIGSYQRGLCVLDPSTGIIQRLLHNAEQPFNCSSRVIWVIMEDSRHNMWIGTTDGLIQYNRQQHKFIQFRVNREINALVDNIQCFTETKDGKIWIGTKQGIRYFDYAANKFTDVPLETEQISDNISGIVEDKNGMLWLTTANGLLRYNVHTGKTSVYNSANGLPVSDLTFGFYKDEEDNILIGVPGGITTFNPLELSANTLSPPPVITAINIDNMQVPLLFNNPVHVRYDQTISIDFISLNYSHAEHNQYAYKLKGIDKDWTMLGVNHTLRFSNLPAGRYTLQLKAAGNEGSWNEHSTDFGFVVLPPFWKTAWFISLLAVIVISSVYALYRYRLDQLIRMERLRTRISADLHDDIGSTLSSISFYSEAIRHRAAGKLPEVDHILEKMGETSRSMVGSMSDIVWAINPDNDHFDKLVHRMHANAAELCSLKNVTLQFGSNETERNLQLSLEQRKNVYLIFREAINNALKYSGCTLLQINLHSDGAKIRMEIRDNGKGFDFNSEFDGNGLKNMQQRAKEIQAQMLIESAQGKGTGIVLDLTVQ